MEEGKGSGPSLFPETSSPNPGGFRAVSVHAVGVMERSNRAVQGRATEGRKRTCTVAHILCRLIREASRAYEQNYIAPCIYAF